MTRYVLHRLAWAVVVLFAVSFITFFIYIVMPPNDSPYESFTHGQRTARASALTKEYLGLNRPLSVQYGLFVRHLVIGDQYGWPGLGYSFQVARWVGDQPILSSYGSFLMILPPA